VGPTRRGKPSGERQGFLDFINGLRYLQGRPFILVISLVKAGGSLTWGAINVLELPLAERFFSLGEKGAITLSIFYTLTGIGSGLGPLLVRRWLGDGQRAALWAVTLGFALLTAGAYWLAVATTLPTAAAATLVRTLGGGTLWVFSAALLQILVDDQFRGRVFAFEFAIFTLTQSIATLWAGMAQDNLRLGVREVLFYTSIGTLVVTVAWVSFHLLQLYFGNRNNKQKPVDNYP
jgi:hypothetical protein